MRFSRFAIVVAASVFVGCSSGGGSPLAEAPVAVTAAPVSATVVATTGAPTTVATTTTTAAPTTTVAPTTTIDLLTDRPFTVFAPSTYDEATAMPLIVLLHGYSASGDAQEAYFQFQKLAEERGFLYVHPDGLKDPRDNQFWNATDACCNFVGTVDDSAYLSALIAKVESGYNVDPKRIFFAGHSNGGFMSYRMACDHSDKIAAIASLAGATFADVEKCATDEPVSVLQIHGTADETISYTGAEIAGHPYPSAATTTATWAGYNGCAAAPTPSTDTMDLEGQLPGAETTVQRFDGCPAGIAVELWTINGGPHIPGISAEFSPAVVDFLLAHPKP